MTLRRRAHSSATPENAHKMFREGILLTVITLISKISGFIREWLTAFYFGTNIVADAIKIAVDLTKNLNQAIAGSHVETTLVPLLTRWRTRGAEGSSAILLRLLAWSLVGISVVLALGIGFFSDWVTRLQAPGYSPEDAAIVSHMLRWISPSIPLFIAANLAGYLLGSVNRFRTFALFGSYLNVGLLAGVLLTGGGKLSPAWVSIGYTIAMAGTLAGLIYDARDLKPARVRANWNRAWMVLKPFLIQVWPLAILAIMMQTRVFIDKRIVSGLGVGAVAALWYARFIVDTPSATVGLTLVRMMLPRFSEMVERKQTDQLTREFSILWEGAHWILLPAVVILAAAPHEIIIILFGYGKFDASAVAITSLALIGSAPSLLGGVVMPLINRIFNAEGRNHILLYVGFFGHLANIALAIFLAKFWGVAGVALAAGLAQLAMTVALFFWLPGKMVRLIAWQGFLWWCVALLGLVLLKVIPFPEPALISILSKTATLIVYWLLISMILPGGRANFQRIIRSLKHRETA